jgi:hypothetical protein
VGRRGGLGEERRREEEGEGEEDVGAGHGCSHFTGGSHSWR